MTAPMMRKRNPTPHSKGVSKMPAMTRKTPTRRSALRFSIDGPRRTSHVKVWHSFRGLLGLNSAEREDFVDEFRVGQDHSAAAVALEPEGVEDLGRVLSLAGLLDEGREGAPDDFATRETADGDDHAFTGTISGASCEPRARGASSAASGGCPGRSTSGRILGTVSRALCRSGTGRARGRSRSGRRPPGPSPRPLGR